jgi:heptosyltransferase-2
VVGPAWVGDMVMAHSLFRLLGEQHPGVAIDVVAPAWSEPLLGRMDEVRKAVIMPLGHGEFGLAQRFRLGRELRGSNYDHAIVLPRSFKSALVPFFAAIPSRTGFRGEMRYGLLNDIRQLDRTTLTQTVTRFAALGLPADAPLTDLPTPRLSINHENLDRLRRELRIESQVTVALMPGAAYGPAKCWPIDYFAKLAASLIEREIGVIILGSAGEHDIGKRIQGTAGDRVLNLCGQTRLEDTVDLLSMVDVAVSNDSGLMHVAAAAGTHVVGLYGSSSVEMTPPLTKSKTIFYLGLECSPCFERECPLGHFRCLREISPVSVFEGVLAAVNPE